jgi:vacuolar protein sorting-associated protein 45
MNVIKSVQLYLDKMIEEAGVGMKILLMNRETVSAVMTDKYADCMF